MMPLRQVKKEMKRGWKTTNIRRNAIVSTLVTRPGSDP
jgi:hypothetical protein